MFILRWIKLLDEYVRILTTTVCFNKRNPLRTRERNFEAYISNTIKKFKWTRQNVELQKACTWLHSHSTLLSVPVWLVRGRGRDAVGCALIQHGGTSPVLRFCRYGDNAIVTSRTLPASCSKWILIALAYWRRHIECKTFALRKTHVWVLRFCLKGHTVARSEGPVVFAEQATKPFNKLYCAQFI